MILETKNLTQQFGGLTALDNVSLTVKEDEIRAVIGPNGAGKTTFFNIITGVQNPVSGKVFFKGKDITNLPPHERVKLGMGRSFQKTNIFPELTVKENIGIAAQTVEKNGTSPFEVVRRRSIKKHIKNTLARFHFGKDLSEKARSLPHADQRRLEIAMAMASNPDLLLLDEPTAGMTDEETSQILHELRDRVEVEGMIIIEHDIDFVEKISDHVSVLNEGQIIAEGTPKEVSENEKVRDAYLGGV